MTAPCRLTAAAVATLLLAGVARATQSGGILGEWRGTSLCTDRALAPACRDEQVRYTFRPAGASRDSAHLVADKLVNGAYELMYEIDLARDRQGGAWAAEFRSPRGQRGRWAYTVLGDSLAGTLMDLPSGGRIRVVAARRQ